MARRLAFRRIQNVERVEVTRINDPDPVIMLAHLLKWYKLKVAVLRKLKKVDSKLTVPAVKVSAERTWTNRLG